MPKKLDRKNLTHNFQKLAFKQLKILTNALKAMKNTKKKIYFTFKNSLKKLCFNKFAIQFQVYF